MKTKAIKKASKKTSEALVSFPLSALRYLSKQSSKKKIVVEISAADIKRINGADTLDEIINEARLDYAKGDYSTHKSPQSLIAALEV